MWYFILFIVLGLIIASTGYSLRCPSCGKWWSKKFVQKKEADRENSFKTVIRKEVYKNRKGRIEGSTEREEQINILVVTYKNYYRCSKCNYNWTEEEIKEIS